MNDVAGHLLLLIAFRALPFAVYACVCTRFRSLDKVLTFLAYLSLCSATAAWRGDRMLLLCFAGMAYYLACACAVPHCAGLLRRGRIGHATSFVVFAACYLVLPVALLPQGLAFAAFLVVGWELLLSSYSYCHDIALDRAYQQPCPYADRLGHCLFFLFVDPTLAYHSRGRPLQTAVRRWRYWARAMLGVGAMWFAIAVLRPAYGFALQNRSLPALAALTSFGVLRFLTEYALHSGLASIQISLLRQVGYAAPERYHLPWLARDPFDFWRRWNVYVGTWLRRYVFLPLSRRVHRLPLARLPAARALLQAVLLLTTAMASGLLHDGFSTLATGRIVTRALGVFSAIGVAMCLWAAMTRLGRRMARSRSRAVALGTLSRAALLLGITAVAVVWG